MADSPYQKVNRDFTKQNYLNQFQTHDSESDNNGGIFGLRKTNTAGLTSLPEDQCNYYRATRTTRGNLAADAYSDSRSDTAAEYDCADEDMDGPDSVCINDVILHDNQARVESMNIQKPTINQSNNSSSGKKNKLKKLLYTKRKDVKQKQNNNKPKTIVIEPTSETKTPKYKQRPSLDYVSLFQKRSPQTEKPDLKL